MRRIAFAVLGLALAGTAGAGWFGPSNYDECVLENLKGVSSDMGARMVAVACMNKFPPKKVVEKVAQPTAPVPSTTPVLPAKCYKKTAPQKSNGFDVIDFDCLIPEPAK